MTLRSVATAFGLVGGLCWVVRAFVESQELAWTGFALLAVAAITAGATLVSSSAVPLRVFVAIAFPLLAWSVLEVARDAAADHSVDAVFGAAAAVAAAVAFLTRPVHGNH
jgi:hypothetical protein